MTFTEAKKELEKGGLVKNKPLLGNEIVNVIDEKGIHTNVRIHSLHPKFLFSKEWQLKGKKGE